MCSIASSLVDGFIRLISVSVGYLSYGHVPGALREVECWRVCAGGYARAAWTNCSPSSGPSFVSEPQRRARFPGLVSFSFTSPLKSQWALQAFEDTRLGMRGVCAAQGNGVPRKAVPAKRSGKACLCKTGMREGMRTIYIYILLCTLARGYARGYAHHIYIYM